MNKIVQDIAEHCDFYVGNEHSDKSHEERQRLFMEKFAELIVLECASAVNSRDDSDTGFWANIIKEHFGVEV